MATLRAACKSHSTTTMPAGFSIQKLEVLELFFSFRANYGFHQSLRRSKRQRVSKPLLRAPGQAPTGLPRATLKNLPFAMRRAR
jgi:hypothetical protein